MGFLKDVRNKLLYAIRAHAFNASNDVEWIELTMYDEESVVDLYDTASLLAGQPFSPFRAPCDLEFLDMVQTPALDIQSVLDLGCGAGAFYHALSSVKPDVNYYGYDLSSSQIRRAKQRFGDRFAVRDISTISTEEFAKYDAVHVNSVFSFMSPTDQIGTIERIMASGAKLLTETGVTQPDIRYAPRSSFKNFNKAELDGRALLTVVSFPYLTELKAAISGFDHELFLAEQRYSRSMLLNDSTRSGGALIHKLKLKRRPAIFRKLNKPGKPDILIRARISPSQWARHRSRDYSALSPDEVRKEISSYLRPL